MGHNDRRPSNTEMFDRICMNNQCLDNEGGTCDREDPIEDPQDDWHLISCKNVRRE